MDERVEQRLLEEDSERADERVERPPEDAGVAMRVTRRRDHALEIADRRVRGQRLIVDVRSELLFDDAEQIDARERVEPDVL